MARTLLILWLLLGIAQAQTIIIAKKKSATITTARAFNGTSAQLSVAATELAAQSSFTISLWMKSASTAQTNRYLLNFGGAMAVLYGYANDGGVAQVEMYNCNGATDCRTSSQITIPDTGWHHVAYRKDGLEWAFFLDGAKTVIDAAAVFSSDSASGLYVGSSNGGNYFQGSIARVYLSTAALTDGQIAALAGSGCSSSGVSGTVGYWLLLGDDSPETESSPSPNTNSLTVTNATKDTSGPTCSGS